jgi:solute carrier family 25 thiamine pyrophosphate transporter 19
MNTQTWDWRQPAAGGTAGIISRLAISPIDVVKIRLQLASPTSIAVVSSTQQSALTQVSAYRSPWHALRQIIRTEGPRALWKGNWSAEYLYFTYGACQFTIYHHLTTPDDSRSPLIAIISNSPLLAGATAGSLATVLTYPFDLLRTRFAVQLTKKTQSSSRNGAYYSGLLPAIRLIANEEGWRGFYRGLWPSLLQISPYMGLMFSVYSALDAYLSTVSHSQQQHSIINGTNQSALCGAVAGTVSKLAVYPLDTIRRRLQVQLISSTKSSPLNSNSSGFYCSTAIPLTRYDKPSVWRVGRAIVYDEGWRCLWRGVGPAMVKSGLGSAITFTVYNAVLRII